MCQRDDITKRENVSQRVFPCEEEQAANAHRARLSAWLKCLDKGPDNQGFIRMLATFLLPHELIMFLVI